ncbi:MAG: hypothetical protein ABR571_12270 [Jatrophihabitans sp.]|uniref:hypothetical protein n=1 Tax=Jatrophihabitans sp. TaxID=1932789 RepID=UPI0039135E05
MTYIHVTRTPDMHLSDYRRVVAALGEEPIAGRRRHYVGESDGALHTVDEWVSRADADRFAAERLFPAFDRAGVRPSPAMTLIAFEAGDGDD